MGARSLPVLLLTGLWSIGSAAAGHADARSAELSLEQQLELFLSWFPGEYDNHEQNWQDNLSKVEQVHERIHHIFYPATAMQVGEHTFFVQQYLDGNRDNVYRQRLYHFTLDQEEGAIRLDIYSFLDEARYRDAHLNPDILATLDKSELVARPGCEVYWEFKGDHFHGYMKERACSVMSRSTGQPIYITDDLRLTPDEIWIRDEAFDGKGQRVFGNRAGIHHKNRKVQYYTGWAGVATAGPGLAVADGSWANADGEWAFRGELDNFSRFVIHNEGEIVPILNKDGKPSGYSVQLAKLTYQNTVVPILTLKLWEDATRRVLTYSWAATDSERIGLNARWAQIGLTVAPGSPSFGFEIEPAAAP
ncbi:MAG: chromophore lyase CpcT/CpeT [Gammaproteobacteria bacterium]|nr:chromophore lyase CpcT/CpeT [Gammaproteobacteria bacterium]